MLGYADNGWTQGGLTNLCSQYGGAQAGLGNTPPNSPFVPSQVGTDDTFSLAAQNQQIACTFGLKLAYYEGGEAFGESVFCPGLQQRSVG